MEVLVKAGIPVMDVLKMATIQNAQAIGLENHLGSIEISKWADLAIMKGNPLLSIQNTRNIHTVVKSGVVFLTKDLLTQCINKLGPTNDDQWMK